MCAHAESPESSLEILRGRIVGSGVAILLTECCLKLSNLKAMGGYVIHACFFQYLDVYYSILHQRPRACGAHMLD